MKLFDKIREIKKAIFWRDVWCPECSCYGSISNRRACLYCKRGDMATQRYDSEDEWWNEYMKRFMIL